MPNYMYYKGYFGPIVSTYALYFLGKSAQLPTKFCCVLRRFRRDNEINFFRLHFLLQMSSGGSSL